MPILTELRVVRSSTPIAPSDQAKHSHLLQQERFTSENYLRWIDLCNDRKHTALMADLTKFVTSPFRITSLSNIPVGYRDVIEFAEQKGFSFAPKELQAILSLSKIKSLFVKGKEQSCPRDGMSFRAINEELRDQIVARTKLNHFSDLEFDIRNAVKTLDLAQQIVEAGKAEIGMNIDKFYNKPFLLKSCGNTPLFSGVHK